ncbi:MAG: formyltransferase family protein [Sedimenticola sp.]
MKILLTAYYSPGIRALDVLFAKGYRPEQIALLSHRDSRNGALIDYAGIHGIELCTAPAKSDEAYEWIKVFSPDAIFSLYYREIFPVRVLSLPSRGAVNLHPSLLPRYRGAFSAPWIIFNGENLGGYTYHYMNEKVDEGDVLLQQELCVNHDDTAYSLYHRVIHEAMKEFGDVVDMVANGVQGTPQQGEGSYFSRKVPFEGVIDPNWDEARIDRFIRAMYFPPFRGAIVRLEDGQELEIDTLESYRSLVGPRNETVKQA